MSVELIVPVGLIVCLVKGKTVMEDTFILPLSILVKHKHLLSDVVSIDHVKIKGIVLLEEELPLSAPVVVRSDWNQMLDWDVELIDSSKS